METHFGVPSSRNLPGHEATPVEKQTHEQEAVAHRLKEALANLPKENIAPSGTKPKEVSELKGAELYKSNLLQRIILKSFLCDIVFGTKEQLAIGEVYRGFNDIYREMVLGKKSPWKPFHEIVTKKIEIPLSTQADGSKIACLKFAKEGGAKDKPVALIITGSYGPSETYAAPIVKSYLEEGFDVLVIDPVGFGESANQGSPTPENFLKSAEAATAYMRNELKVPNSKAVIHGYSLGGFAAAHAAGLKENEGMNVVLDRCPASSKVVAETFMKSTLPILIGSIGAKAAGKIVDSCIAYDLKELLPKIHGKVFVAQTDLAGDEAKSSNVRKKGFSAYALIEKLERKHKLDKVAITKSYEEGEHMTAYSDTWMRKQVSKTNKDFKAWLHKQVLESS